MNSPAPKKPEPPKKPDFERSLARLEEVVRRLESPQLSLDDAMKLFEEGVALSREMPETTGRGGRPSGNSAEESRRQAVPPNRSIPSERANRESATALPLARDVFAAMKLPAFFEEDRVAWTPRLERLLPAGDSATPIDSHGDALQRVRGRQANSPHSLLGNGADFRRGCHAARSSRLRHRVYSHLFADP